MKRGPDMRRQRGQVLIIIFVTTVLFAGSAAGLGWLYGGNNFEQLRKQLKQHVQEPDRRKSAGRILEQLNASAEGYNASHERQIKQLLEVMKRHDGSRAEFDRLLSDMDAVNLFSRRAMLDLRYQLREGLSAQEWTGLFPLPDAPAQR